MSQFLNLHSPVDEAPIDWAAFKKKLHKRYFAPFLGYIAVSLHQISNKATSLLFLVSLSLNKYGLSDVGATFASRLGFCLPPDTFRRYTATLLENTREFLTARMLYHCVCVMLWFDNFAKQYYSRSLTIENAGYRPAKYTPCAVYFGPGQFSNFVYCRRDPTAVLPCLAHPASMLSLKRCERVAQSITVALGFTQDYWWENYRGGSFTVREKITSFPLQTAEYVAYRSANPDMPRLRPYTMFKPDVGSTHGLAAVLHEVHIILEPVWAQNRYTHICVDVNIYLRMLKFFFSTWTYFPLLQVNNCLWAGTWHTMKQALKKIWEFHWLTIIAPVYRSLFGPDVPIVRYTLHQTYVGFFSDLSHAYSSKRPYFVRAYNQYQHTNTVVMGIKAFFEYFLPWVRLRIAFVPAYEPHYIFHN